jgi:hypothetical protein
MRTNSILNMLTVAVLGILVPGTIAQVPTKTPARIPAAAVGSGAQGQTKKAPVAPVTKSWTKEPDSFRDARFLSSSTDVRSKFEFDECVVDNPQPQICRFEFRLADVDLDGLITFSRDALVEARAIFEPDDFSTIRSIFVERYGEPTSIAGDRLAWMGKSVSIELTRSVPAESKQVVTFAAAHRLRHLLDAALGRLKGGTDLAFTRMQRKTDLALRFFAEDYYNRYELERDRAEAKREYERDKATADRAYEKDKSEADLQVGQFESASHSGFSITVNEYAIEVAKRKFDVQKRGAGAL